MIIDIVNISNNKLPKYETLLSAGMDLRAYLQEQIVLKPLQRTLVKTGLFVSLNIVVYLGGFGNLLADFLYNPLKLFLNEN